MARQKNQPQTKEILEKQDNPRAPMRFDIVAIFPKIFDSYLNESLFKRARKNKIVEIFFHDIRKFSTGRHKKARPTPTRQGHSGGKRWSFGRVDDKAFGGGPGMVIQLEPVYKAVQAIKLKIKNKKLKVRTILFSTRGKKFDARAAKRLSKYDELILICGRYEGVDERVAKYVADEELSIGDYVLSGGEIPALVTIEAVSRFLPGFLGKYESLEEIKGSYPVYTRPPKFFPEKLGRARSPEFFPNKRKSGGTKKAKAWQVPGVLLSGNHKKIKEWRRANSEQKGKE